MFSWVALYLHIFLIWRKKIVFLLFFGPYLPKDTVLYKTYYFVNMTTLKCFLFRASYSKKPVLAELFLILIYMYIIFLVINMMCTCWIDIT